MGVPGFIQTHQKHEASLKDSGLDEALRCAGATGLWDARGGKKVPMSSIGSGGATGGWKKNEKHK